jgi:hypothetical protein
MATKNQVTVGVNVTDNGTTAQQIKNAEKLKQAYDGAAASAAKLGGTAGSRAAAELGDKGYRQARGAMGATGASARDFARESQGLSGLVRLYAVYAANIFAVGAAFRALSSAMDTTNMIRGLDALGATSGKSLGTLSKRISDLTDGAVSLREAMETTAKGSAAGLSSQQMERLAKVAKSSSLALGVAMPDALNRLSRGISKLEPELLDELGIFTKIGPAVTKYAASMGRAEGSLTDFERRQAFANAVLEEGEKKFAAINDQIQANPYDKLTASLKNTTQQGLELVNMVLVPIVEFLSQTPGALVGVLGLLGTKVLKQAGLAFSEFKNSYLAASETLKEQNMQRMQALEAFNARSIAVLTKQANVAADSALDAFEEVEAGYKKHIASMGKVSSSNLSKLFDPTRGISDINEQEWAAAEKRLKTLEKLEQQQKLTDKQSRELAAGRALFEAKLAEDNAREIKRINEEKFNSLLKQSNAYTSVEKTNAALRLKATQNEIAGNFVKARSLYGVRNAWAIMNAEIAMSEVHITRASKAMIYFKAVAGAAAQTVATGIKLIGAALNKLLIFATIAITAFEILDSIFSGNAKQSANFSSAVDASKESVENADRTTKNYIKTLGYFNMSSIESAKALSNAFTEITQSSQKMFDSFEANINAMSGWDKFIDSIKSIVGYGVTDKMSETLGTQLVKQLDLATRSGRGAEAEGLLMQQLGITDKSQLTIQNIIDKIKVLGTKSPQDVKNLLSSFDELGKGLARTAGRFDQLGQVSDALIKSQQEFYQSTASKDPLFKLGESALNFGYSLSEAFQEGTDGISAFYDKVLKSPEILGTFSDGVRKQIIAVLPSVIKLTNEIGLLQEKLRNAAELSGNYSRNAITAQRELDSFVEVREQEINRIALSAASRRGVPLAVSIDPSNKSSEVMAKFLTDAAQKATYAAGELANDVAQATQDLAKASDNLKDTSVSSSTLVNDVLRKAKEYIDQAVVNANKLAFFTIEKAYAKFYTASDAAKVEFESSKADLEIKIAQVRMSKDQIDSMQSLNESIKELNATLVLRAAQESSGPDREARIERAQRAVNFAAAAQGDVVAAGQLTREELEQLEILKKRQEIRTKELNARLTGLNASKEALEINYRLGASVAARVADENKVTETLLAVKQLEGGRLDTLRNLNMMSEEEYLYKKYISDLDIINLNAAKEQNLVKQQILSYERDLASLASKTDKDSETRKARLQAGLAQKRQDLYKLELKQEKDLSNLEVKRYKEQIAYENKIFTLKQANQQKLNDLEIAGAQHAIDVYTQRVQMEEQLLDYAQEQGYITEQMSIEQKTANALNIAEKTHALNLQKEEYAWELKRAQLQLQISRAATGKESELLNKQLKIEMDAHKQRVQNENELYDLKVQNINQTAKIQYEKSYEALRTSIMDGLMEGGPEGAKKVRRAIENELKKPFKLILEAVMKPFVNAISSVLSGFTNMLLRSFAGGGLGSLVGGSAGSGGFGLGDIFQAGKTAWDAFTGGFTSTVTNFAYSGVGASLGLSTAGASAEALALLGADAGLAGGAAVTGSTLTAAGTALQGLATAAPYVAAFIAAYKIIDSLSSGETRSGGTFLYTGETTSGLDNIRNLGGIQGGTLQGGTVGWLGGPSGGMIGGQQGRSAVEAAIIATVQNIDSLFEKLGSESRIDQFWGKLETSDKNRGGVLTGGILTTGQEFGETGYGSNYQQTLFETYTAMSLQGQEAMNAFLLDLQQVQLQALQVADDLPSLISEQLAGVDIELLNAEQVTNLLNTIQASIGLLAMAEDLGLALNELSAEAVFAAGGAQALTQNLQTYYSLFYTEEERFSNAQRKVNTAMEELGLSTIDTTQEFRALVDGLDLSIDSNQVLFGKLMELAPAFYEVNKSIDEVIDSIDGLSKEDISGILMDSFLGNIEFDAIGTEMADSLYQSVSQAVAQDFIDSAAEMIFTQVIQPIVSSLITGSVSGAAAAAVAVDALADHIIDTFNVLAELFQDADFQLSLKLMIGSVTDFAEQLNGIGLSPDAAVKKYQEQVDYWKEQRINYLKNALEIEKQQYQNRINDFQSMIKAEKELISARDEQIKGLEEQKSVLEPLVNELQNFLKALKDFKKSLLLSAESPLTPGQKYLEAKSQLQDVVGRLSSPIDDIRQQAQQEFQNVSSQFLEASRNYYSSSDAYTSDFEMIMGLIDSLESSTGSQLSTEEQTLNGILDQIQELEALNKSSEDQIARWETSIENEQKQINLLQSQIDKYDEQLSEMRASNLTLAQIDANILNYSQKLEAALALQALQDSVVPAGSTFIDSGSVPSDSTDVQTNLDWLNRSDAEKFVIGLYRSIGRDLTGDYAIDQGGLDFWTNALNSGTSQADLTAAFYSSAEEVARNNPEYLALMESVGYQMQSYGSGTDYLPFDQVAQVHEGERIVPKADNVKLFQMIEGYKSGSDTNQQLIQEIQKLNQKIENLERTISEGDVMNAEATERNTEELCRELSNIQNSSQYQESLRRRTQL